MKQIFDMSFEHKILMIFAVIYFFLAVRWACKVYWQGRQSEREESNPRVPDAPMLSLKGEQELERLAQKQRKIS